MYTTPGLYFEQIDRGRPAIGPLRTDIAAFVGYAERGPLFHPVKINSWRQFTGVFGNPLPFAHLPYAVQGFFENGGVGCYITRIADRADEVGAAAASGLAKDRAQRPILRFFASHGQLTDPLTQGPLMEDGRPLRLENPGSWGNRLSLSLYPAGLGRSETIPDTLPSSDGSVTAVKSLSGFEIGSIVQASQNEAVLDRYRLVKAIDTQRRWISWDQPLFEGFIQPQQAIRLETVEFTLQLFLDGQEIERHENLSLSPDHSRFVINTLQANSGWIDAQVVLDTNEYVQPLPETAVADRLLGEVLTPLRWPAVVDQLRLSGGRDGLATVDKDDFLNGLAALEAVDEISILAAPDAVLNLPAPATFSTPQPQPADCDDLNRAQGQLCGRVLDAGRVVSGEDLSFEELDRLSLADVTVDAPNTSAAGKITASNGLFLLQALPVGLVTIRLQKTGYISVEVTAEARVNIPPLPVLFFMSPITTPPALDADDIAEIQHAMLQQGANGLYRVALLDPPLQALGFEAIQTWRARFDSTYGALYYPWLLISDENQRIRTLPPSGHVAGLLAHTDLTQGVHKAPANRVLDGVKALSEAVDDAQQGVLNPLGINCIRVLPGRGIRVYGARTVSSDAEWRYLNVRRLLLMLEEAIEDSNQWAVFEPNNQVLRQTLTYSLNSFLNTLWRQGALAGDSADAAYQVKCNDENNPASVVDVGQVIADIAVAPTIPFEFIRFRLGRTVEAVEVKER